MPHFTDRKIHIQHQRGFSLIEAMFSALILAVALLGLAGFQAVAMNDGSLVKARSVAASLAQEKLDDLRSFATLDAFDAIADDEGGFLPKGPVNDPDDPNGPKYTDNYERAWTVTCATEAAGTALSFGNTCTGAVAKLATVTISWTDSKGDAQSVSLQGVIYAMDPYKMALSAASAFSTQRPKVGYTPIGVPDAVPVPINTGTGELKESSKPVPEVSTQGIAAEVSFDAVSYSSNGSGGYDTTAKEEFLTVACECMFDGTGTGSAPSRMIWNGVDLVAKVGDEVSKTVGVPADNGQSEHCTACCRDHHDAAGQAKYDPGRPDSEYVGGNHKHYWYSGCVTGTQGETSGCNDAKKNPALGYAAVTSGAYLESCRFMRVDGFWRVWQDWRQVKMTVVPYDYLQDSANLNAYVDVIEAAVEKTIRTDSGNGSVTPPALDGRDIAFGAVGQARQLLSRAVYVDRIYQEDNPTTLDADYYAKLVELIGSDKDWLNIVPFYEVNLTLLTDWSSNMPTKASVTSQNIVNIGDVGSGYYNSYSRGKVTALASGSDTPTITATARLHNTGVTGGINYSSPSYGISVYDNSGPLNDSISVTLPGSSGSLGISGKFVRANTSANFSTLQVSGATCSLETFTGGNELGYTCTTASGSNVTLTYSSSASDYSFSPASQAFGEVTTAQVAGDVTVYGPTVQISGTIKSNANVTNVSLSTTSEPCAGVKNNKNHYTSYICVVPRGTSGYSGTVTFTGTGSPSPASQTYSSQQSDVVLNVN